MDTGEEAFDGALGGDVELPHQFVIGEIGKHRVEEILMLSEALSDSPYKGQLFQRLPKHMRRRQMSHHNNRLPRRLRVFAEMKSTPAKRPSRKFRRRPTNLLAEYNRRKKSKIWLETHIWHAKRFHMSDHWGYRLPETSNNKGFRANYRAIRSHCLLTDMSYLTCLELIGPREKLLEGLGKCTSPDCGLTFAARVLSSGQREGKVNVFHPGAYPNRIIGNVSFVWSLDKVWIWAHPAFFRELVECFCGVFNLSTVSESIWKSTEITLKSLKDTLNRYRLTGPLSSCIISDALSVAPFPKSFFEKPMEIEETEEMNSAPSVVVVEESLPVEHTESVYNDQKKAAEELAHHAPNLFPSGAVLGLVVSDPRMGYPDKRIKINKKCATSGPDWHGELHVSPLWHESIRETVTKSKPSDKEVSQLRSSLIVPSGNNPAVSVPILVVQQPGSLENGFGAGWDLIIPSGWGLPIWRSLVLRGARVGALRETRLYNLETGLLRETLQPDSCSGQQESKLEEAALREKYFRLPPSKRPNFIKLGIHQPFSSPWNQIIQGEVHVIRDQAVLRRLSDAVSRRQRVEFGDMNGLVAVHLMCSKGRPETLARVYLPQEGDWKGEVIEPVHQDWNKAVRVEEKRKHEGRLREWRKDRKRKKNGQPSKWNDSDVKKLREDYIETCRRLWLPSEPVTSLREMVGCVSIADFSFRQGRGCCIAYVSLQGILTSLTTSEHVKKRPSLLVRNVAERHYRMATFRVFL